MGSKAFAGGRKLLRNDHYGQKKVLFKKLIFHLESPAGLIFPKVARPGQLRCKSTWLFTSYAQHVLQSFGLWDTPPPAIPHATLLVRNRTPTKNVGRIMSNPQEVEAVLRKRKYDDTPSGGYCTATFRQAIGIDSPNEYLDRSAWS